MWLHMYAIDTVWTPASKLYHRGGKLLSRWCGTGSQSGRPRILGRTRILMSLKCLNFWPRSRYDSDNQRSLWDRSHWTRGSLKWVSSYWYELRPLQCLLTTDFPSWKSTGMISTTSAYRNFCSPVLPSLTQYLEFQLDVSEMLQCWSWVLYQHDLWHNYGHVNRPQTMSQIIIRYVCV